MGLLDFEASVEKRLGKLPYQAYLCAMCVIGGVTCTLYLEHLPEEAWLLSERTLREAEKSVRSEATGIEHHIDGELAREWDLLLNDPQLDGPPGMLTTLAMFEALAGELTKELRAYAALTMVTATVADYGRRPSTNSEPRLARVNRDEAVDDENPGIQLLRRFDQVARLVADQHSRGFPCDPGTIQSTVFG